MSKRILVVDDDVRFVHSLSSVLNDAGYDCLFALDGEAAIRTLEGRHEEIDLLIVDLGLPKISGFEVIGAVTRRRTPTLKIIATSALFRDRYMEIARHIGAHETLRKPEAGAPLEGWLTTIRQLLESNS
jgi:two-component system, cell cycle sensor histidine kinase and response regulator CckA